MQPLFSCAFAILLVVFLGRDASAQNGGYVVRGAAKVINGNTIRVSGVDVTLSGVETVEKYDGAAARSLKKRIGNKQVGCMVDGNWSGKNWGYCGDPRKPSTRDVKKTLNAWVIAKGWAMSDEGWNLFGSEESKAKKRGLGMWK